MYVLGVRSQMGVLGASMRIGAIPSNPISQP